MFNTRKKKESKLLKDQEFGISLITYTSPQSINAEQFRAIRTNIEFAQVDRKLKSLLISSCIPAEGKSTVSANLAVVMAQTEKKVLIVDADMRKPTLHRTFRIDNKEGLSTLIANPEVKFNQVVQHNPETGLYLLPCGPIPPNPSELLGSARMTSIMHELNQYFDLIIYDTPPITAVADPQILATRVDGILMVLRYGYVRREEVRQAKEILDNVNANILGYVMNGVPREEGSGYYSYYGYGYGHDSEKDSKGE
ncbi:CpsD/CapB family tyrosine-protein kinase [Facklamia sp. P13055]|uniref:CpsD/CapB family tyrosine-protein kinase n=1 Tax=Facklamia sp. P13055 TaxID=3421952 RepID=UPI003D167797